MDSRSKRSVRLWCAGALLLGATGCSAGSDTARPTTDQVDTPTTTATSNSTTTTSNSTTSAPPTTSEALTTTVPSTPITITPGTITPGTIAPGTITPGTITPGTIAPGTGGSTIPAGTTLGDTSPPSQALAFDAHALVEVLSADEMGGRDNLTDGSESTREVLADLLTTLGQSVDDSMVFFQSFDVGTNVIGVIPGSDLRDEYVMIGAHSDHLGSDCGSPTGAPDDGDHICNGATDNATGVAVAMATLDAVLKVGPPRRSIVVAFWDAEEDGLLGSRHYAAEPLVPLAATVAYLNFDIQGADLLPSLANWTIMVGAETGGEFLRLAAAEATSASTLRTIPFSLVFGQGRSDHASLIDVDIPSVFFTDSTSGCYHTTADDLTAVNFDKLDQQIATATALATRLLNGDAVPVFDDAPPVATFDDAVQMSALVEASLADLDMFAADVRIQIEGFLQDLGTIIEAGPDAFDDAAVGTLLGGAAMLVASVADSPCSVG